MPSYCCYEGESCSRARVNIHTCIGKVACCFVVGTGRTYLKDWLKEPFSGMGNGAGNGGSRMSGCSSFNWKLT